MDRETKTMKNKALNFIMALGLIGYAAVTLAGTDTNAVINLSGSADTVSPVQTPGVKRRATLVRYIGTNADKTYIVRSGSAESGSVLWGGYLDKDEHDVDFAAGTTGTMTWKVDFLVPNAMYLQTDDTTTSGNLYIYTRPDNTE